MKRLIWLLALLAALLMSAAPVPADDGFYVIGGAADPGHQDHQSALPH